MSKLRLTFSRLLAFGGLTAVSGTSFALYKYSLFQQPADCKGIKYPKNENEPLLEGKGNWDDDWDFRGFSKKDYKTSSDTVDKKLPQLDLGNGTTCLKEIPTATRHVVLVRHGQYVKADNDETRFLSKLGREQATMTGERLKALNVKFNGMTVSTMTRAQETGSIISKSFPDVKINNCSLLREGAPYQPDPAITHRWSPKRLEIYEDNPRIEAAFRKYIHRANPEQSEDSYDLLVCHGNVIRYFVCRALQFPPEGWLRMSVANCGITWLTIRPNGRVSLRGLGDVGHLPAELITFN